jgi:hypothetical protein
VYAALGNPTAKDILLNLYQEASTWPAYADTLGVLQSQFKNGQNWDANVYSKWLFGTTQLMNVDARSQPFMQTENWRKRCLNTALAAYAGLKHDFVLYAKQGAVAECGGMEPPPPPLTVGYVEPNIAFWSNCSALLKGTEAVLKRFGWLSGDVKAKTNALKETAEFLSKVSAKELRDERLSDKEFETIRLMGSTADDLMRSIMNIEDWSSLEGPDKSIALVSDVFTNGNFCLQEAVGKGNSLYVIVEINGYLYLTRGSVYSYYEFIQPSSNRLTDEAWQEKLESGEAPPIPVWMQDLMIPIKPLEPAEGSSYSSGC